MDQDDLTTRRNICNAVLGAISKKLDIRHNRRSSRNSRGNYTYPVITTKSFRCCKAGASISMLKVLQGQASNVVVILYSRDGQARETIAFVLADPDCIDRVVKTVNDYLAPIKTEDIEYKDVLFRVGRKKRRSNTGRSRRTKRR